jgi:hypothetical protein
VNNTPALITTTFNHPFSDGEIVVKVGADVVARQTLWKETRVLHRHEPLPVNMTTPVTPKNADLEIFINVPSMSLHEHRVFLRQLFPPGSTHQLVVSFDKASGKFAYKFN